MLVPKKRRRAGASHCRAWLETFSSKLWETSSEPTRRSLSLEALENRVVPAFVINPTFASSITSDPNSAAIISSINRVLAAYQNSFSDNVTVNLTFQEGGGLGSSTTFFYQVPYSTYRTQLTSHATTADDSTAPSGTSRSSGSGRAALPC